LPGIKNKYLCCSNEFINNDLLMLSGTNISINFPMYNHVGSDFADDFQIVPPLKHTDSPYTQM